MSKAKLIFSLPEESEEHQDALNGWKYKAAISDMYQYIRRKLKDDVSDEEYNILKNIQREFLNTTEGLTIE